MNIVVAGGGIIGLRIAEQLMETHVVVVIGPRDQDRARLERLKIRSVDGSITSPAVQRAAGVTTADVFLAASRDDEKNIVACVAAHRVGAKRVICFLSRRGFFAVGDDTDDLADSLGIDAVVRPAAQLAEEIIRIVTVPGALDVRAFAGGRIHLQKYVVEEGSPLADTELKDLRWPAGSLAVMGQRASGPGQFFIPRGDSVFSPGDRVTVMGTPKGVRRSYRYLTEGRRTARGRSAVIVGGGLVGGAVAEGLVEAGWHVKVIEADRARCTEVAGALDCLVIHGDGADLDLLEQELVHEPDALVAVTSNDEKNLLISLLAQHLAVPRVITRADRLINERIFEKVGVDVVLSAKGAAIRRVVNDLIESDEIHVAELEHGDFSVLDIAVPPNGAERRVSELHLPGFAIIGAVIKDRRVKIPTGKDTIGPGDHLLVVCSVEREADVHASLSAPAAPEPKA